MLVCLPACGLLRRNGARPARNGRFARPCDRSPYTYMSSGRSPARLVSFSRVPLRWRRRSKPRMAPSGVRRGARGARPLSRSLRRRSRRLHGETRRNASSANTPPRLATCLAAHPTNRVAACRSVRHSPPRPLPHLPQGAFFFEASALADLSLARLTTYGHKLASRPFTPDSRIHKRLERFILF